MSLRIYIKGTPKFHSPRRSDQSLPVSPQFNTLPPSKIPRPSRRNNASYTDSKDESVTFQTSPRQTDNNRIRSSADMSLSSQGLFKRGFHMNSKPQHFKLVGNAPEPENIEAEKLTTERREPLSKQEIQQAIMDFSRWQNSRKNVPDKQLRDVVSESDRMIATLLNETERLHDMLLEKSGEVQNLHEMNSTLRRTSAERLEVSNISRDEAKPAEVFTEGDDFTSEALKRATAINAELTEEIAMLREMASTTEKTLRKERESYRWLKAKAEELINLNNDLNNQLRERDAKINSLESETHKSSTANEKLAQEITNKNQMIEELTKSLVMVDFQSPRNRTSIKIRDDMNHSASPFPQDQGSSVWNAIKTESPNKLAVSRVVGEDMKALQKKYDSTRSDNGRLIKLVEGNQLVMKNLRDEIRELEERSSKRYREVKAVYEERIRIITNERTGNRTINESERNNDTAATKGIDGVVSMTHSPTELDRSKRAIDESLVRAESEVPRAIALYNNNLIEKQFFEKDM